MSTAKADLAGRWRLHPRVSLRPEPFGALAYHYDNRRLNFLRSPDLVELVRTLEDHHSPRAAFDAHGIAEARWPSFSKALIALAQSDFIQPCQEASTVQESSTVQEASTVQESARQHSKVQASENREPVAGT